MRSGGLFMCAALLISLTVPALVFDLDPNSQTLSKSFAAPDTQYWLGADQFGRDLFARLIEGGRYSLMIALPVVALCLTTGLALATLSLWQDNWLAAAITLFADATYALPGLLLVLVVAGLWGGSALVVVLALWLASWPEYYRVALGVLRRSISSEHVRFSRRLGASPLSILRLQVVPDALPHLLALGSLSVGRVMLAVAALGFLGLGVHPPQSEWGSMLSELLPYRNRAPVQVSVLVLTLLWTVMAFQLLSRSLTELPSQAGWADDQS